MFQAPICQSYGSCSGGFATPRQAATADDTFTPSRTATDAVFGVETEFYTALHLWCRGDVWKGSCGIKNK